MKILKPTTCLFLVLMLFSMVPDVAYGQLASKIFNGQDNESSTFIPYMNIGFDILAHNGMFGGTVPARPDGGEYNPNGGDWFTGLGFGVVFDYRVLDLIAVHFDINNYNNSTPVAYKGGYASSDWVWEMNDYNQRLVGPFSEDANYVVNTTGMRLGLKLYPVKNKKFEPWYGIYFGYWAYNLGIYSGDKKSTYGNISGSVTGLSLLNVGVDFWDKNHEFSGTLFFEGGAPAARNYSIENCINTGWTFQDYGEGNPLFGYYRLGLAINMVSTRKKQ